MIISKETKRGFERIKKLDKAAWLGLFIAIWGIRLTYKIIDTSVDVKQFTSLLNKEDIVIGKQSKMIDYEDQLLHTSTNQIHSLIEVNKNLSEQISILSNQYSLSQIEQKTTNKNAAQVIISDEAKFYLAVQNLQLLTWRRDLIHISDWAIDLKIDYLNKVNEILNNQLNNPYLLSNRYMFEDWLSVRDSIFIYTENTNFIPVQPEDTINFGEMTYAQSQKILKDGWRNCFIAIMYLSQATNDYMTYYKRRHLKTNIKRPSSEFYKKIIETQNRK